MELARDAMGLAPARYRLDPALKELTFGDWEGLTWPEVRARDPKGVAARHADKWDFVPPEGESYAMLAAAPAAVARSADGRRLRRLARRRRPRADDPHRRACRAPSPPTRRSSRAGRWCSRTGAARGSAEQDLRGRPASEISGATILLLAVACGVIVANIYYAQPLVGPIAAALGLSPGAAGLIVTLAQIGYGLGLLFIVPLGDRFENRRLVVICVAASALALALASASRRRASAFLAAMGAVGLASVAVQILVPLAAHLAPDASRGRVVGLVSSGVMIGIMAGAAGGEFRRLGVLVARGVRGLGGADGRAGDRSVAHASGAQAAGADDAMAR